MSGPFAGPATAPGTTLGVRRRAWTVMRALQAQGRRFTAAAIAEEIRAPLPRVASLMRAGLLSGVVVARPEETGDAHGLAPSIDGGFAVMPLSLHDDAPASPPRADLSPRGRGHGRSTEAERLWNAMRDMPGHFAARDVADAADVAIARAEDLARLLVTIGFAEIVCERDGRRGGVYRLLERGGARPPSRQPDGTIREPNDGRRWDAQGGALAPGEADPPPAPEKAWLAIRAIGGTFTVRDIALLAEANPRSVAALVELLVRIGYVLRVEKGGGPRQARYRLVVRSGPRAPRAISGGALIDPNDGRRWDAEGAELPPAKRGRRS